MVATPCGFNSHPGHNYHMNQKGFVNIAFIILIVVLAGTLGFIFTSLSPSSVYAIAPKTQCETGTCKFKMATLLISIPGFPATEGNIQDLKTAVNLFEGKWNSITPGIQIDATDFYQFEYKPTPERGTGPGYWRAAIPQFYRENPGKKDTYDFITIADTWTEGTWFCDHKIIPHRLDVEISSENFCGDGVNTCRFKGLNWLANINKMCGGSIQDIYWKAGVLMRETVHQWGVIMGDFSNYNPLGLTDSLGPHYGRNTVANDFLNVGTDFYSKNTNGKYENLGLTYQQFFEAASWHDMTLFQMGLIDRGQVSAIDKVTTCDLTGCSFESFTIDEVFPKDNALLKEGVLPSNHDSDRDGILNWAELQGVLGYKTNFLTADTDGDGVDDLTEIQNGTNPLVGPNAPPPPQDTQTPTISNISISNLTESTASINWSTNEPADGQIEFSTSPCPCSNNTPLVSSLITTHVINLFTLTANTTYYYRIKSKDTAGNLIISTTQTFKTAAVPPPQDILPPVRSSALPSGTLTSGITQTNISLTTNESATCRYSAAAGTAYDSMTNTFRRHWGNIYSTLITSLTDKSSYTFYVRCKDTAGNKNTSDYSISFSVAAASSAGYDTTTPASTPTPAPTPTINQDPQLNTQPQQSNQSQPAQSPLRRWLPTIIGISIVIIILVAGAALAYRILRNKPSDPPTQE